MKFDMTRAWNEAMALFRAHGSLMAVIAGLFVFLPNLAFTMLAPQALQEPQMAGDETPEQVMEIMSEFYAGIGPWMIVLTILSLIGSLAMYALVTRARPTVGDALKTGFSAFVPALLAQLIFSIGIAILAAVLIGLPFAIGLPALVALTGLLFLALFVYSVIKLSLTSPVIVIEGIRNPITALKRSWQLTKGNSFRLLGFYAILVVCIIVVALVFAMVTGLFVALLGEGTVGLLISGILSGAMSLVFAILGVAVLSAVHRQLAGPAPETSAEVFD